MLPDKEWNKIKSAIASGQLQLKVLSDEEYAEAEKRFQAAKENKEHRQAQKPEILMPKGTKVEGVYQALLQKGYSKESAARIAQAKTGQSLKTGKPSKKG
jgi:hypothetical protein